MKPGFGIDFGTTNSLIAYYNPKLSPQPGAFLDDGMPHPSLVWYRPGSQNPVVGREARRNMNQVQNQMGHRFVHSVKRLMAEQRDVPVFGTTIKPSNEVGADILQYLLEHARSTLPQAAKDLGSCVMTVPVNSTGRYRRELRRAAELVGLQVESFTHEPFAALFGWFFQQGVNMARIPDQKVLIFDWGGGTLDVTLVQVSDNKVSEIGNSNLDSCAGNEFTSALNAILKQKFLQRTGVRPDALVLDAAAMDRVWTDVEDAKIQLSTTKSVRADVPNYLIQDGTIFDLGEEVERQEYESGIEEHVHAAKIKVHDCLHRAGVEAACIDLVLLIGGTSRTPLVQEMMNELFVSKVVAVDDADAIIAKGAAVISAFKWKPYLVKPITLKLADKTFFPLFKHGETLTAPITNKTFTLYCVDGRTGSANLLFYEQEQPTNASQQRPLNTYLSVPTSPAVARVADLDRIIMNAFVTEDLTIKVEAFSASQGAKQSVELHDICYGLEVTA